MCDSCVSDGGCPFLPLPPSCLSPMTAAQSKGWGLSQLPPHTGIKCPPWLCSGARTIQGRGGLLEPGDSSGPAPPRGIPSALLARVSGPARPVEAPGLGRERGYSVQGHPRLTSPNAPLSPPAPNLAAPSTAAPRAAMLATPSDAGQWLGHQAKQGWQGVATRHRGIYLRDPGSSASLPGPFSGHAHLLIS